RAAFVFGGNCSAMLRYRQQRRICGGIVDAHTRSVQQPTNQFAIQVSFNAVESLAWIEIVSHRAVAASVVKGPSIWTRMRDAVVVPAAKVHRQNGFLGGRKREPTRTFVRPNRLALWQGQVSPRPIAEFNRGKFLAIKPNRIQKYLTPFRLPAACELDAFHPHWRLQCSRELLVHEPPFLPTHVVDMEIFGFPYTVPAVKNDSNRWWSWGMLPVPSIAVDPHVHAIGRVRQ